jgi:hypothetical protein
MKILIACFALAVLITAAVSFEISVGRSHHDAGMRAVHYDSGYDLSARRRTPQP